MGKRKIAAMVAVIELEAGNRDELEILRMIDDAFEEYDLSEDLKRKICAEAQARNNRRTLAIRSQWERAFGRDE